MNNKILENNLPYLSEKLQKLLPKQEDSLKTIHIVHGKKNLPVAQIITEKSKIHSNSLVDPWREAELWAETLDYKDVFVSFIYGCGFGYPLLEYTKRKKQYTTTIILERNIELFYAMLCELDLQPLLKDPSFRFVIGDSLQMKNQLEEIVTSDFIIHATKPASFFTWLSHRTLKETYLPIHEWIWNTLQLYLSSIGNSVHDTLYGMYNMIDNVDSVLNNPSLSKLKNAYHGKPAFIVSNGPSLDKNVELLKEVKGKALILAAESALKPILKRDIEPDGVCIIERGKASYEVHFKEENLSEKLVMIGLNLIDPRIPKDFPGPWIPIFRRFESSSVWMNEIISDGTSLLGGGSSAHLAFEFAIWTGCNPIIFIGQDLALGTEQETHSKFSSYSEEYLSKQVQILQAQPRILVKGVDGNLVSTIKIWYEFKSWFEDQIAYHPDTQFIDATEGGAYIQGTELMTLQQVINSLNLQPLEQSLYEKIQETTVPLTIEERKHKYEALLLKLESIQQKIEQLVQHAKEDINNCKIVEKACTLQPKEKPLPAFIKSLYIKNSDAFRKYASDEEIVTFTQSMIFSAHIQMNEIGEIDSIERLEKITKIQHQMLEYIQKTCELVVEHFQLANTRVRQHMQQGGLLHDTTP